MTKSADRPTPRLAWMAGFNAWADRQGYTGRDRQIALTGWYSSALAERERLARVFEGQRFHPSWNGEHVAAFIRENKP